MTNIDTQDTDYSVYIMTRIIFDEMIMMTSLYQKNTLFSASSLKQKSTGRHVAPVGHINDYAP